MKHFTLIIVLIITLFLGTEIYPCTSFMLPTDSGIFYAHSLNQGSVPSVPGLVFYNPSNLEKSGFSWHQLTTISDSTKPAINWISKYSSLTFNTFGKDLPDGGMNSAGLFIWEMGFDTEYPSDSNNPTLFQCEWMMYQLDNYATVAEVLENIDKINLDGWGWHYFIADKSGHSAIVDFIGGKAIVHDQLEIPLCCNSSYPEALALYKQHPGFDDKFEISKESEEIDRFLFGAHLLESYTNHNPIDYSFNTLDKMSVNVRWAVVFDVARNRAYFKTNLNQTIKEIDLTRLNQSDKTMVLEIEQTEAGEVTADFLPYSSELNHALLSRVFGLLVDFNSYFKESLLDRQNTTPEVLSNSFNNKINRPAGESGGN